MNLRFLGAAGEVTGSCYLVDTGALKFLVDCGMFQGGGSAELLGWIGQFRRPPGQTWIVHGEPLAAQALKDGVVERFGWRAEVASAGQELAL